MPHSCDRRAGRARHVPMICRRSALPC